MDKAELEKISVEHHGRPHIRTKYAAMIHVPTGRWIIAYSGCADDGGYMVFNDNTKEHSFDSYPLGEVRLATEQELNNVPDDVTSEVIQYFDHRKDEERQAEQEKENLNQEARDAITEYAQRVIHWKSGGFEAEAMDTTGTFGSVCVLESVVLELGRRFVRLERKLVVDREKTYEEWYLEQVEKQKELE